MGLLIDTSSLIAVERASAPWDEALLAIAGEPVALPTIVYAELLVGVRLADTPARAASRRSKIDALVAAVPVIGFDRPIAERWRTCFRPSAARGCLYPPMISSSPRPPFTWAMGRSWGRQTRPTFTGSLASG